MNQTKRLSEQSRMIGEEELSLSAIFDSPNTLQRRAQFKVFQSLISIYYYPNLNLSIYKNSPFLFLPPPLSSQIISTQPIPRTAPLKRIPRTSETTFTLRRIHAPRSKAIPTIAFAAIFYAPVCIAITIRVTHLKSHGSIVVQNGR